jgi:hypothetical protein
MPLPLKSLGRASSWGSLLYAYEPWALDDEIHQCSAGSLCKRGPRDWTRPRRLRTRCT